MFYNPYESGMQWEDLGKLLKQFGPGIFNMFKGGGGDRVKGNLQTPHQSSGVPNSGPVGMPGEGFGNPGNISSYLNTGGGPMMGGQMGGPQGGGMGGGMGGMMGGSPAGLFQSQQQGGGMGGMMGQMGGGPPQGGQGQLGQLTPEQQKAMMAIISQMAGMF